MSGRELTPGRLARAASPAADPAPRRVQPGTGEITRKSPLMMATFLGLWALSIAVYGPRGWQVVAAGRNALEWALLAAFGLFLVVFWMLAAYYLAVVVFALLVRPRPSLARRAPPTQPKVAVLYPTCNDFQVAAAASCVDQEYPNFHVFLLDDSTDEAHRAKVDAFHAVHPAMTTVVRRSDRRGFKAGNLNHALRGAAAGYTFFAVVDADERLPADFLTRALVPMQDPCLAFVQANHAPNPHQQSAFARDIAATILPFWGIHCRPRNRYGFVLYLGHGAVVRRDAWERAGGFPEVVLEDLAFSAVLGTAGLRGAFLDDLRCYEDFPDSYLAFKRQHERYIIGTTQVFREYLRPLLASPRLGWIEKLDFCLWCSPLYVPALCLLFIALCSIGLPAVLGHWTTMSVPVLGTALRLPVIRVFDERFAALWSGDFRFLSILAALSPAFACLALGIRGKLRPARLLFLATMPYLSVMLVSWRGILGYLLLGRTFSPPTGESVTALPENAPAALLMGGPSMQGLSFRWRTMRGWETWIGLFLALASIVSCNVGHVGVCCCLLVGAWAECREWDAKLLRAAAAACFAAILLQMFLTATMADHSLALAPLVFSVHL